MKRNNVDDISLQALLETLKDLAVSFGDMHILQTVKCLRNNVTTSGCTKNRRCESSSLTSP